MSARTTSNGVICEHTTGKVMVRCAGCNALWSTKNIGWRSQSAPYEVVNARSLFPAYNGSGCICSDKSEYSIVHVCGEDCEGDN